MLSRKKKDLFYKFFYPFMTVNGWKYKNFLAPKKNSEKVTKVHLGPGRSNYFEGWLNLDANIFSGKADVWVDLRNPLPFNRESVDFFYSHHVIEHLPDIATHFEDLYRCLKPNGKMRIGGPNGDSAIQKFYLNDKDWFINFPDDRESIGGKFENFIFCRNEHLTILTFTHLSEMLTKAGFKNIKKVLATKETRFPEFVDSFVLSKEWEKDEEFPITLMIECEK